MEMVIVLEGREVANAVEEFVYGVCGGPTKAAHKLECSSANLHEMIRVGNARTREMALRMEAVAGAQGATISAAEFLALEDWHGPERHPDAPSHGKGSGNGTSTPRKSATSRPAASVSAIHAKAPNKRKGRKRGITVGYPSSLLAAVG